MGLTLPIYMTARIVDELGVEATTAAYALVDPTEGFASVSGFFDSWLAALDGLSDGYIVGAQWTALPSLPTGLKTAAASGSRVGQTGIINFMAAGSSRRWAEPIPALSNATSVVTGSPPQLVTGPGTPASALYSLLLTRGSSVIVFTNDTQQSLVTTRDSLITFRRYPDQLSQKTFEYLPGFPE